MPRMQYAGEQVDFELRVVKAFKEKMEPFQALLHLCISSYEMRLMQRPQVRGSEYTA